MTGTTRALLGCGVLVLLLGLMQAVAACESCEDPDLFDGDGGEVDGMTTDGDAAGLDQVGPDGTCVGAGDQDGDGILDGLEDLNCNGVWDPPAETDFANADTDGDGIDDGIEDVDQNGQVSDGELDPRSADSDGDGIPDSQELLGLVCNAEQLTPPVTLGMGQAQTTVALPAGFQGAPYGTERAGYFSDGQTYFGFVVTSDTGYTDPVLELSQGLAWITETGFIPIPEAMSPVFKTWDLPDGNPDRSHPGWDAARVRLKFELATPETMGTFRDALAGALNRGAVVSGETGPTCGTVTVWQTAEVRDNGTTTTIGVAVCNSGLLPEAARFVMDDLTNSTHAAIALQPRTYNPRAFTCEELRARSERAKVDFLWVVDNSGSMADEQSTVAATASTFMKTLQAANLDWRIGVTTTEAYALTTTVPGANLAHDELLDTASGLRGGAMLAPTGLIDDPIAQQFVQYVTYDLGCLRDNLSPPPPPDSNVCGNGLESGLRSGLAVLDLAAQAGQRRSDARVAVVWVSDEEDQSFKDGTAIDPWLPDDPRRNDPALVAEIITPYVGMNAIGCAIVGDVGSGQGGVCTKLDSQGIGVVGAQPGLGYIAAAQATGGVYGSICNDDLGVTVEACIDRVLAMASSYPLSAWAISGTIRVAVDGALVPRSRTAGWDYDHTSNSIVFFGVGLTPASAIAVAYKRWSLTEG